MFVGENQQQTDQHEVFEAEKMEKIKEIDECVKNQIQPSSVPIPTDRPIRDTMGTISICVDHFKQKFETSDSVPKQKGIEIDETKETVEETTSPSLSSYISKKEESQPVFPEKSYNTCEESQHTTKRHVEEAETMSEQKSKIPETPKTDLPETLLDKPSDCMLVTQPLSQKINELVKWPLHESHMPITVDKSTQDTSLDHFKKELESSDSAPYQKGIEIDKPIETVEETNSLPLNSYKSTKEESQPVSPDMSYNTGEESQHATEKYKEEPETNGLTNKIPEPPSTKLPKYLKVDPSKCRFVPSMASEKDVKSLNDNLYKKSTISRKPSHKVISLSKWKMKHLIEYVTHDVVNLVQSLVDVPRETANSNNPDLKQRMINVSGSLTDIRQTGCQFDETETTGNIYDDGLKLWTLQFNEKISEATVRSLIQPILDNVCTDMNLTMKMEVGLKKEGLPGARADYFLYHNNSAMAVIETKQPETMSPQCMPQFLMQLLHLQAKHSLSQVGWLGFLTDGYRFVFASIKGLKFSLEAEKNSEVIKIYRVNTWEDLHQIFHNIKGLLLSVKKSLDSVNSTTDDEYQGPSKKKAKYI